MTAFDPDARLAGKRKVQAPCLACGAPAPIGMDGRIGPHETAGCKATGKPFAALRSIARLRGSWAVRWKQDGAWKQKPCGEKEARREAIRLGGFPVSLAVIAHLERAGK